MKTLAVVVLALASAVAVADEAAAPAKNAEPQKKSLANVLGGKIDRPRSQQGRIAVLDTQSETSPKNIAEVVKNLSGLTGFKITTEKVAAGKPATLKETSGANAVIVVVANDDDPPMLVAPEDCWAVVNVRKLRKGLPDNALAPKIFDTRCRKEISRAFHILCGGFGSPYKSNVVNVARVEDFELASEEGLPYDTVLIIKNYMKTLGVTPVESVFYRTAVKEGWAPAPTNDAQKAVWEKVKEAKEKGPSNPIKIAPPRK